jgi:hypothetical protein
MTERRTAAIYVSLALIAGAISATVQGFSVGRQSWFAAAVGGPVFGLVLGALKRLVSHTHLERWVLVGSLLTLAVTLAGAQCAMCFFVR